MSKRFIKQKRENSVCKKPNIIRTLLEMGRDIEIHVFERVIDCGRDVDANVSLAEKSVTVRSGLSAEQYVKIGINVGLALNEPVQFVGDVE